jgi:DNA-binding NarL/FixJ family response regulator
LEKLLSNEPKIRVMVVEDDPQMRALITQMVRDSDACELTCSASSCAEACECFRQYTIDVLLMDLQLPDGSGLDLIKRATLLHPNADIMVITVFGDESTVFKALENGASGYLLKDSLPDDFIGIVQLLRAGGAPINPIIARQIVKRFQRSKVSPTPAAGGNNLTAREIEILNLIARGFSTLEVAVLIGLSAHTVVSHIKKVYSKLRVNSRSEALYEANMLGVLSR